MLALLACLFASILHYIFSWAHKRLHYRRNYDTDIWEKNYGRDLYYYFTINIIEHIISLEHYHEEIFGQLLDGYKNRMFPIVLFFLISFGNNMIVFSHQINDVILKFIIDVKPILFPPSRLSLHVCVSYGKTFEFLSLPYWTKFFKNSVYMYNL